VFYRVSVRIWYCSLDTYRKTERRNGERKSPRRETTCKEERENQNAAERRSRFLSQRPVGWGGSPACLLRLWPPVAIPVRLVCASATGCRKWIAVRFAVASECSRMAGTFVPRTAMKLGKYLNRFATAALHWLRHQSEHLFLQRGKTRASGIFVKPRNWNPASRFHSVSVDRNLMPR
jgi:hypothetical protein